MKFLTLELDNIFAYRGRSILDLSHCTPERNIVIVQGRNGQGKTSLLNAVKLLFLGADDERMRRVGFGAIPLPPKAFVTGQQGRWDGVFNKLARVTEEPARVALTWTADDDVMCRAERVFFPLRGATEYREQLTVVLGHRKLENTEARQYLQTLLPREVVPFFFFDGEQIQSLADAEIGRERAEIERLLGLYFVAHITREIEAYGRERKKAGLPETVKLAIAQAEGAERTARLKAEAEERSRVTLEEEIGDLDTLRHRLERERAALRNGLSEAERKRLEDRIIAIGEERADLASKIAIQVPVEVPAIANLALTQRAFRLLEEQLEGAPDASIAARVHRTAPEAVLSALGDFDETLQGDEPRETAVRGAVKRALTESGLEEGRQANPLFSSISPRHLRQLRDRFLVWSQTGEDTARAQVGWLQKARQLVRDEAQFQRELEESDITTDEARARYAELTDELEKIEADVREKVALKATHAVDELKARREQAQYAEDVQSLYAKFENVVRLNAAYQVSQRAKRAVEYYRQERRGLIRASVEARLREKAGILLGPSQLIKSVDLDEQFGMTYRDDFGEQIGRHSLSAGMRQLAAMSMLWALKEEAKRPLPVIIDTPLGRIDRENRNILMKDYFPQAGMPLIVLPTNSEMTDEDFTSLSGHIAKHYEIRNEGGLSAKLEEVTPSRRMNEASRG